MAKMNNREILAALPAARREKILVKAAHMNIQRAEAKAKKFRQAEVAAGIARKAA